MSGVRAVPSCRAGIFDVLRIGKFCCFPRFLFTQTHLLCTSYNYFYIAVCDNSKGCTLTWCDVIHANMTQEDKQDGLSQAKDVITPGRSIGRVLMRKYSAHPVRG